MWLLVEIAKIISGSPSLKYPSGVGGVLHRVYLTIVALLALCIVTAIFFDTKEAYLSRKNKDAIKLAFQKRWDESGALREYTPEEAAAVPSLDAKWNEIEELRKKVGDLGLKPVLTPAEQGAQNLFYARMDKIADDECLNNLFSIGGSIDSVCTSLDLKFDDHIKYAEIKTRDFFGRTIWTLGIFVSIILLRVWLLWIIWGVKPIWRRQP